MDEELKKILDEINLKRKSQKSKTTSVRPYASSNVVNMDFASLYPTQQKWYNVKYIPERVIIRRHKIKNIFNI